MQKCGCAPVFFSGPKGAYRHLNFQTRVERKKKVLRVKKSKAKISKKRQQSLTDRKRILGGKYEEIAAMLVKDLRQELLNVGLSTIGVKSTLVARLRRAHMQQAEVILKQAKVEEIPKMLVKDLKQELANAGCPTNGLKSELAARLRRHRLKQAE